MFGYIKPYKPEMKMKEFDTYKAVYCGLCKQLGKVYGPFARFTLSYDFTFLSLISVGMKECFSGYRNESCVANPLKKKPCLVLCDDLTFGASAAMVMFYYKLRDNYEDGGIGDKIKSLCLMPFAAHARKKARETFPFLDEIMAESIRKQHEVEHSDSLSIDRAAEPTAAALSQIFSHLSQDSTQKTVLEHLGYLVGRYVYLIDALDDLEEDIASHGYNIFYRKFQAEGDADVEKIRQYALEVINLTVGQIASAYELLELRRYKPILDNVVYLGLHDSIRQVLNRKQNKEKKPKKNGVYYGESI